ncbi:serine hydrolase domain-containing protein [Truepera radiovictrix]|uniref:Beta-lactamase n=1 Tax=Truepera radiovictrix (strain DSM 17093 / CIP 108686 / LMG 22925 / RQ-24) TaxID=649638 RepID=D7CRU7_TRURR|nr:serine hydrolase domain-containing protein [Truepera radiovictrix]ADI15275.1 beta-lactamase [Truepera radiovictrix DSM 17093]WMT56174.1 serine hydrolase domain-containing protein [Truepera radiovictrix]
MSVQLLDVTPEAVGFSTERLKRIRPVMQAYVDGRGYPGISTLLSRRGRVFYAEQVGWRDRERDLPLTLDTIYRIYSMTKPVVCTALMTLFEEGRFLLTDPLAAFLPAFERMRVLEPDGREVEAARPILVGDLFTHTAGLTYDFLEDAPAGARYREAQPMGDASRSLAEVVDALAELPLAFHPGSRWHYSVATDVLARLIEVLSGTSLQHFLQERLFGPLGMTDTGFWVPHDKRDRLAAMYGNPDIATHTLSESFAAWQAGKSGRQEVEATYPSASPDFARGGHGLFSTITDYLRFAQMLLNRGELDGVRLLAPKTVAFMHLNHLPAALLPYEIGGVYALGYGFGLGSRVLLDVAASGLPGSVGEFGWSGAAKTYYWVDPQEELVGLFMTQYMVGFEQPEKDFVRLAYQALVH